MTINIAQPNIGDDEIVLVNQVLQSGMLAQGPKVAQLEENFANYCGTKYAVMVNSGTAAIHSAL
ncbi:MAG TPA: DegT/DnrJ/EryC1/StrS family aminotransferase, partial [Vicingus sp.]|nr:DegT/DnrJ/EryC1/StrS family aminotransferase [Vicingus sp.]